MAAEHVQSEILEPMQGMFLPPRNLPDDMIQANLREYVAALERFEKPDLAAAWGAVRDTHTTRAWPMPAAFVMAARQAEVNRLRAIADVRTNQHGAATDPAEMQAWDVWKLVCRSELGRQAVVRNISWSLKCAILHDKKLPHQVNLDELVRGKASAERTAAKIQNGEPLERNGRNIGVMSPENARLALKMWDALLVREAETQAEINYRPRAA